jgi:glycosyltransferase involved in cell wall biosynthesis
MRVALVGPTPPLRGGIVAYTEGLRVALEARGHSVERVSIQRLFPRWISRGRVGEGSGGVPLENAIDALAPTTWRRAVESISADVVVAQHWTPILVPALTAVFAGASGSRRLLVCHNFTPHEYVPGARRLVESLLRRADAAIFHSRHVETVALARIEKGHLESRVVPMPMLIPPFTAARRPAELAVDDAVDVPLIALVGHLRRYKGLDCLAGACRLVDPELRFHLVIAGEPIGTTWELGRLVRLARPGVRVTVVRRYLEDAELIWLLQSAATVMLPYSRASQSGVLPLALRLSRHIVLSDAGGLAEQVGGGGAPVSIVPARDSRRLALAIAAAVRAARENEVRALRQGQGPGPGAGDYASGWRCLVAAVESLGQRPGAGSNTARPASSLDVASTGDEPSSRAWYHAGRLAFAKAEMPTT